MELYLTAFGYMATLWATGFGVGLAIGFVRRLRDAA